MKLIKPQDYVVIVFAALVVLASVQLIWFSPGYPLQLVIKSTNGQQLYDLTESRQVHIHGESGESVIEIKQGKVRFVSSACTGKQCVIAGWQDQVHDTVACLPNGVSFTLVGRDARFDSINF